MKILQKNQKKNSVMDSLTSVSASLPVTEDMLVPPGANC